MTVTHVTQWLPIFSHFPPPCNMNPLWESTIQTTSAKQTSAQNLETCFSKCLIRRVANIIRFLHFAHLAICCSRFAREWDLNSEQGMPLKPSVFHQSRNWNSLGPRRDHKKEAKELYTPSLSSWPVYCGGALLQRWIMVEVDYANLSGVSLVQSSTPQTWKVLVCEGGRRFLMPPLFCASSQPNWLR